MESSFTELNILLDYLQKNPLIKIHIEGHTDNIGGKEYNITLSENRAAEVLSYLYDRGIEEQRMTYKGQGDNNPIATNKTELGRSKNRRTSFVIVK
jgi:outer membrane protein OmpA-like peptidoglycan-associated protein